MKTNDGRSQGWGKGAAARAMLGAGWLGLAAAAGCAHGVPVQAKGGVPASGEVVVRDRPYGVRVVELRLAGLPARDPETAYVVWTKPRTGDGVENLGTLRFDEEGAFLEAVTSYRQFELFVTAEPSPTVARPSQRQLFSAAVLH